MTVINFDEIIGKGNSYITNNVFCLNHPTNTFQKIHSFPSSVAC